MGGKARRTSSPDVNPDRDADDLDIIAAAEAIRARNALDGDEKRLLARLLAAEARERRRKAEQAGDEDVGSVPGSWLANGCLDQ